MPTATKKIRKPKVDDFWIRVRDDVEVYVTKVTRTEVTFHVVSTLLEYTRDIEQFQRNYRPKSV